MKPFATPAALAAAASGRLSPVEAIVVQRCDGATDLDALGAAAGLSRGALLDHLDALADAGMLAARVAPPTGVSRRGLLGGLLGATAVAAATSLPRVAQAAPADNAATPAMCYEAQTLELTLEEPSDLLAGQDPADLLRLASRIAVSEVDTAIDASDAAADEAENAAKLLAELTDAHASLTLELAADAYLEYTAAAALGDPGPLGREGDQASQRVASSRVSRERWAKQMDREVDSKERLAQHDEEAVQTYDRRKVANESAQKAMTMEQKLGANEKDAKAIKEVRLKLAQKVRVGQEAAMKDARKATEKGCKARSVMIYNDFGSKETSALRVARVEEVSAKHQQAGDLLDARLLDGALAWAVTDLDAKRRDSEKKAKQQVHDYLQQDVTRGISVKLRDRAEEGMQKRDHVQLKVKKYAEQKAKQQMSQENKAKA
jgi:hypothetical protein